MRKSGFFPRLALVNLVRNGRFYGPYLLSCGMTAAMYYILSYLTRSDIVASGKRDTARTVIRFVLIRLGTSGCHQQRKHHNIS